MTPATWALISSLYVTSFMGPGFFLIALVTILRQNGASLSQLNMVYFLGTFWVLKCLWAPWVDRIRFGRLGHYRGWLLLAQAGMIVTFYIIGRFDVLSDFFIVLVLCMLQAFLSATQDIAADGLVVSLLAEDERALGNSVQSACGLIGNMLGGGVVLMAYPHIGWDGCMGILSLIAAISFVQLLFFKERTRPVPQHSIRRYFSRFVVFWRQDGYRRWMAMLVLFPLGTSAGYALIVPILVDAGWPIARIGFVTNIAGTIIGVGVSMVTGFLIRAYGRYPILIGTAFFQIMGLLVLIVPATGHTDLIPVFGSVGVFFAVYSSVAVVLTTLMMDHAASDSPATDFTMQFSLFSMVGFGAISISNILAQNFGYVTGILIASACSFVALVVSLNYIPLQAGSQGVDESLESLESVGAGLRGGVD